MANYELERHKRSDSKKWIAIVLAVLLLAAAVITVIVMGVKKNGWFKKAEEPPKTEQPADQGGLDVAEIQGNGIKLMVARLSASDYDEYGVSPLAENAYTLTATITPADAANKKVDWTIAFKNASSSWATGKTVTDYATVTPSSDGALTAVVENVAAFGEQIVVKCTSRDNTSAFANCTLEYLQRTTGYTFNLDGKTYSTTGTKTNAATPTFATAKNVNAAITVNKSTVYTRANTDSATYFTVKPTAALKTAITNAGLTASALKEYSGSNSATVSNFFDKTWGEALYSNNTQKNKLIAALQGFSGNAYEIIVYKSNGGAQLATFNLTLDTSVIAGQKGVESITLDQTEIVF